MWLYNIGIYIYTALIRFSALWYPKARQWSRGRKGLFEEMRARISDKDRVLWLHAASLGEFEQGRPIIERIREEYPDYKILLTFFSPSGYEVRKNYGGADFIFYLPADTPSNARRFLELAHPEACAPTLYLLFSDAIRSSLSPTAGFGAGLSTILTQSLSKTKIRESCSVRLGWIG